jgi:tetratricopeptide (TPR) repeat protein
VHWQRRETEPATADFNRVLELQPHHVPALLGRAELRVHARDLPGAKSDLDAADGVVAPQANVRLEMARVYEAADLPESAVIQYGLWIHSHPEDAQLFAALSGRCWDRALLGRELKEALADCNRAVDLAATDAKAGILNRRGLVRLRLGDYDKAIADYDASLKLSPRRNPWTLYGRGMALIRKNKISEGHADIAEAVKIFPGIAGEFERRGMAP